jgi:hypothetical protein
MLMYSHAWNDEVMTEESMDFHIYGVFYNAGYKIMIAITGILTGRRV